MQNEGKLLTFSTLLRLLFLLLLSHSKKVRSYLYPLCGLYLFTIRVYYRLTSMKFIPDARIERDIKRRRSLLHFRYIYYIDYF